MRVDIRISERLKEINPSSTLAITSKAKKLKSEGKDVISFAAGEPDFDTPEPVKEAGIQAIKSGFTKYTPTTGTPELKKAVCEKFKKDNYLNYTPEQVVVSCGAKHSIFNALFVLVDRSDEVIIPSPYWVSYPEMVRMCEGTPRFIKTSSANNFKITSEELHKNIGPKTKVLILNSPSNPCGSVYNRKELEQIAEICVDKKIFVISDEIYEKIVFDGQKCTSIASLNKDIYELTVTVNGLSKSYSMTGWRIGYIGAPADITSAISKMQDHSTSNPSSISQKAAVAALSMNEEYFFANLAEFQKRRDYAIKKIGSIKGLSCVNPQGAFYIFCDISKTGLDSFKFATRLLDEANVAVIPGGAFGRDDFIRISFACSLKQIEDGLNRIDTWIKNI